MKLLPLVSFVLITGCSSCAGEKVVSPPAPPPMSVPSDVVMTPGGVVCPQDHGKVIRIEGHLYRIGCLQAGVDFPTPGIDPTIKTQYPHDQEI